MIVDLTDVLFKQRSKPRGDEEKGHISDLYSCLRATWYRRNGKTCAPFTPEKLAQFAIGLGYEADVMKTLREAGHDVKTDFEVEYLGLTGHPDGLVDGELVIECKTTAARKPKDEVSPHHAIQAAAYALAIGAPRAIVLVEHAGTHVEATYEINPEAYRAIIGRRAAEVHARTGPGMAIPEADPGDLAPWGCSYCSWTQCPRNPQYHEVF